MTWGQVQEFEVAVVPSTVATAVLPTLSQPRSSYEGDNKGVLVRGIMLKLSPVISWMFIVFHVPLESASQLMVHWEPSLKTAPGPGAVGLGSARLRHKVNRYKTDITRWTNVRIADARKATVARVANIVVGEPARRKVRRDTWRIKMGGLGLKERRVTTVEL